MDSINKIFFAAAFVFVLVKVRLNTKEFSALRYLENSLENSCFYCACREGKINDVKLIIKKETCKSGVIKSPWRTESASSNNETKGFENLIIGVINCKEKHTHTYLGNGHAVLNIGFYYACWGGHMDIINFIISQGANNWNYGLWGACRGGHMNIVLLMISHGANVSWYYIECASLYGHTDIVLFLTEKEKKESESKYLTCINHCLRGACWGGHMDIVLLMIEKGANWFDECFNAACRGGNMDIVLLMMEKAGPGIFLHHGLYRACEYGHIHIVKFIIEEDSSQLNNHASIRWAAINGHMNIAHMLIKKGADPEYIEFYKQKYDKYVEELVEKFKEIKGIMNKLDITDCFSIVNEYLDEF